MQNDVKREGYSLSGLLKKSHIGSVGLIGDRGDSFLEKKIETYNRDGKSNAFDGQSFVSSICYLRGIKITFLNKKIYQIDLNIVLPNIIKIKICSSTANIIF